MTLVIVLQTKRRRVIATVLNNKCFCGISSRFHLFFTFNKSHKADWEIEAKTQ